MIDLETPDKLEYKYFPALGGGVKFLVRAPHDVHVAITSGPNDTPLMYEVFIGGWSNAKSAIRRNKEKPDVAEKDTPGILTGSSFQEFWVTWNTGVIAFGAGNDTTPVLQAPSPVEFTVTHFGVRTAWGASGQWKIEDNFHGWGQSVAATPTSPPAVVSPQVGWSLPGGDPGFGRWVAVEGSAIPPNAVEGGFDNGPLYVGRAPLNGSITPGKVHPGHGVCYISWDCMEHAMTEYEVLTDCTPIWVPTSGDNIPPGALPAGQSESGETLYVGRAVHDDATTIGKVQPSHKLCYIPYAGKEIGYEDYEILTVAQ